MRKAGILMPVSAIPSDYGIGDFGYTSYQFIDKIVEAGFKIWQILPLNPLGFGNSPYQPYSSMAMDELYISLDLLRDEGLLNTIRPYKPRSRKIDYQGARKHKEKYLKKAFLNFVETDDYLGFIEQKWVKEYAVFLTLKKQNEMQCWNQWPSNQKNWIKDRSFDLSPYEDQIKYEQFIQYILVLQWMKLRKYANAKGVDIMGDIPIYVGIDSLDVWSYQEGFILDKDGRPTFIAGVPPDYFSELGQRWGNPIYDWDQIKKDGFDFWLQRLNYSAQLFDEIRIDHFRAFDTYWKIPASCETAIEGEWVEAPGYDLFDRVFEVYPDIRIVVEDLGDLRPQVLELRDHYNLMGMRIVQHSFDTEKKMLDKEHLLAYTGTHDNETLNYWFKNMKSKDLSNIKAYFKKHGYISNRIDNLIQYTFDTKAKVAVVPMTDLLHKNELSRMNFPGTVGEPNWCYKMKDFSEFDTVLPKIKAMIKKANR